MLWNIYAFNTEYLDRRSDSSGPTMSRVLGSEDGVEGDPLLGESN